MHRVRSAVLVAVCVAFLAALVWPVPGANATATVVEVPGSSAPSGRWLALAVRDLPEIGVVLASTWFSERTGIGGGSSSGSADHADAQGLAVAWAAAEVGLGSPPVAGLRLTSVDEAGAAYGLRVGDVVASGVEPWRAWRNGVEIPVDPATSGRLVGVPVVTPLNPPAFPAPATLARHGASAGLAMTLAAIDAHSPGDLTGGRVVAVTGTIEPDGSSSAVDDVQAKVAGAVREGAEVVLVPRANLPAARRGAAGRVEVVAVASLADALGWLCGTGADDAVCAR